MSEYLILKFLHLIAFVYWLGGDLGTFLASRQVVNPANSPESRHIALKIMLACDQGPKMAMPLILPLGVHAAVLSGQMPAPAWLVPAVWLLAVVWLGNVLVLYFNEGKAFTTRLAKADLIMRIAIVVVLSVYAVLALLDHLNLADWLAWKLLVFAALVACGIMIRLHLKPFVPAFAAMMANGASAETDAAMQNSIARCRPFVWAIWLGLFVNAALGVHLL